MSEISERYRRNADHFAGLVGGVPDDRWGDASPCEDWTARDLVRHVVETQGIFLGLVGAELGELPNVDDDPAARGTRRAATVQTRLDDPELAGTEFDGVLGRMSFEGAVDTFLSSDLVVHGWDLARATGQDDATDPAEAERALEGARAAAERAVPQPVRRRTGGGGAGVGRRRDPPGRVLRPHALNRERSGAARAATRRVEPVGPVVGHRVGLRPHLLGERRRRPVSSATSSSRSRTSSSSSEESFTMASKRSHTARRSRALPAP